MTAAVIIAALVLVVASVASEDSSQLEGGMERSEQQCGDLLHTPLTLTTGPLEAAREGYCSVSQPRAMLMWTLDVRANLAAVNPWPRPPACAACSGGRS